MPFPNTNHLSQKSVRQMHLLALLIVSSLEPAGICFELGKCMQHEFEETDFGQRLKTCLCLLAQHIGKIKSHFGQR